MPEILVGGHICLDLIPGMAQVTQTALTTPGHLSETGPMIVSTGGAVSNVGLALWRLGVDVGLMASVGDDAIGDMILGYLGQRDARLTRSMRRCAGQASSYTVVLSPQNSDRMFLHCPGTNDDVGADAIDFSQTAGATNFHFGYPPLMARMYADDGRELAELFRRAKAAGLVTSLDMALPDPSTTSGRAPWDTILANVLPYVDVFVPSIEEILFMQRRADFERWRGAVVDHLTPAYLHALAGELLDLGAVVAGFKLGEHGMYLRVSEDDTRLTRLAALPLDMAAWRAAEVMQPAFEVTVAGTTGAGDSAYAGLLAAMRRGYAPADALRWACAVGACNVEQADSNSGVRPWREIQARLDAGWPTRPSALAAAR